MSKKLIAQLDTIEQLVREGKGDLASKAFRSIGEKPPRLLATRYAELARRLYLPLHALKALSPIVRPTRKSPTEATDPEKTEYGAALIWAGAVDEGLAILRTVDEKRTPRGLLYQAFGLFTQWEYSSAIPLLRSYVASPLEPYQRSVGEVNLAAALVGSVRFGEAKTLLAKLREELASEGRTLLLGNVLELSAQVAVHEREFETARSFLAEAEKLLRETASRGEFFVRKWQAVVDLLSRSNDPEGLAALRKIREEAERSRHWETIRECDLFEAIGNRDRDLLFHVYFGSPHRAYRERVIAMFPDRVDLPAFYDWRQSPGSKPKAILDFQSDEIKNQGERIEVSSTSLHLLKSLARDLYRPMSVGRLHSLLYPNEFFNPFSSPNRVHQAIRRLRKWIEAQNLPLEIRQSGGSYGLAGLEQTLFRIPALAEGRVAHKPELDRLRSGFSREDFTAREAAQLLESPLRSVVRLLGALVDSGVVERHGKGSKVLYSIRA